MFYKSPYDHGDIDDPDYEGEEILARIWESNSDLCYLTPDGRIGESLGVEIPLERRIVFYDAGEMDACDVIDPETGRLLFFVNVEDLDELKRRIDLWYMERENDEE